MTIFTDTSALYAVLDADEASHGAAKAALRSLRSEDASLLTTSYVVTETVALVQRRIGLAAVRVFHEDIYPLLRVVWISESEHQRAMDALLTSARRNLSLVDCVSFQTMRSHGVRAAFCFDAHFREQGFDVRP